MRFSSITALGVSLLSVSVSSAATPAVPVEMSGATSIPDFSNPYHRPSFDEHNFPPPPVVIDSSEKALKKRQKGAANFVVHMCRDTTQSSCDPVWVSAAQYCYDNEHWFGWSGDPGTFLSAKIEGTMCCAFWADKECNKKGGHVGYLAQICEGDSGDGLLIRGGTAFSWMCNFPYGSANVKMDKSPPDVSAVPGAGQGGGAPVATQYAP